jgi:dihydrofolate reductase
LKVTYYAASSLGGYIARADGDVSWLEGLGISMEETGYMEFFATVDGLVMGRKTFEFVYDFGSWPYGEKPIWVCTTSSLNVIDGSNLQNASNPKEIKQEAQDLGTKHLWLVGGGVLAGSFIKNNLLTHLSISQMPIILGGGIRLFGELEEPDKVKRQSVQAQQSGFSQLEFEAEYA